jgi:uncharacterized protein (TIGR02996 family)
VADPAAWRALGLELAFDPSAPVRGITAAGRAQLAADLAQLDAERLLRYFPRDAAGKLPLGEAVLLASVEVVPPVRPPKAMWLVAASPAKRSASQVVTLALQPQFGRHAEHRWDAARWLWDMRAADAPEATRWGTAKLDVELAKRAPKAVAKSAARDLRIAHAIQLLRAGRWRDALAICGVTHSLDALPHKQANHGRGVAKATWEAGLDAGLATSAPWRFEAALVAPIPVHGLRLFNLPGQTVQRKYCVGLRRVNDAPHLAVGITASNERLPSVAWQWPPDLIEALRGTASGAAVSPLSADHAGGGDELLAQIAAAPDDDAPRRVYADYLTERGDPRGELIALQLAPPSAVTAKRAASLVRKHGLAWLGPLGAVVDAASLELERGFLVRATLGTATTPFDAWAATLEPRARAELAHVTELGLGESFPLAIARELLATPPPRLRRLVVHAPPLVDAITRVVPELEVYTHDIGVVRAEWPRLSRALTRVLRIHCPRGYLGMFEAMLREDFFGPCSPPIEQLWAVTDTDERVAR